ncbi:hypothetical protein [Wenyingzhuangia sp. IMCC45574]
MKKISFSGLVLILFLTSCANKYNLLSPENRAFTTSNKDGEIELSYDYVPLRKKYAKKSYNTGVKIAAVKIKNSSLKTITYGNDFKITTAAGDEINVLTSNETFSNLKQKPASHLLYLLLSPLQLQSTKTENGITSTENIFPIGLVIGPAITIGNFITAKNANNKFEGELNKYNIYKAKIESNETKTFLVPVRSSNYPNLKIKLIK